MKKLSYLIVLVLILGLALAGCTFLSNIGQAPATEQSGITYLAKAMLTPNDLVCLWHFDGDADDSSANGNDGTVSGATYVDSPMGQALSFNGVDDYVSVLDSPSLDAINDLTVELWLNPTITYAAGAADYYVFVSKYGPSAFQFVYHPDGYLYLYVTGGMAVRSWNLTLNAGTWYHLAATFDSGTADSHIYVDGVDVTVSTTVQSMTANDSPLFIGARPSPIPTYPKHFVTGIIDEVRIWKVALSPGQLGEIYDFDGFYPPVENLPTRNMVKAGRAIPVKFSLNGDQGLNIFEDGYPKSWIISCGDGTDPVGNIEDTVNAAGGSSLSYDTDANQYIYVWKTDKTWANTCRKLVVLLNDGTYHEAYFTFK